MSRPITYDPRAARRRETNLIAAIRAVEPEIKPRRNTFTIALITALTCSAAAGYMLASIVGKFI